MKEALQYIITSIVTAKDQVRIEEYDENGTKQLVIHVAKDDIGKVIGKGGKIIRAIRNVMKIKAMKHNLRINISLAENTNQ